MNISITCIATLYCSIMQHNIYCDTITKPHHNVICIIEKPKLNNNMVTSIATNIATQYIHAIA